MENFQKTKGFTLIELMIVIAIIGILAAIAIPQFAKYRIRGFNASAEADLRNAMTAEEAYYADNQGYTGDLDELTAYGATISQNVTITPTSVGTGVDYTLSAYHSKGDTTYSVQGSVGIIGKQ